MYFFDVQHLFAWNSVTSSTLFWKNHFLNCACLSLFSNNVITVGWDMQMSSSLGFCMVIGSPPIRLIWKRNVVIVAEVYFRQLWGGSGVHSLTSPRKRTLGTRLSWSRSCHESGTVNTRFYQFCRSCTYVTVNFLFYWIFVFPLFEVQ